MQKERLKLLSSIIVAAVILTIVIQGYWNYRNYQVHQQHFKNDVQQALDKGLEVYYTNRAQLEMYEFDTHRFKFDGSDSLRGTRSVSLSINQESFLFTDSIAYGEDSLHIEIGDTANIGEDTIVHIKRGGLKLKHTRTGIDSVSFGDLTAKIIVALKSLVDTVELRQNVDEQLQRVGMDVNYKLTYASTLDPDQPLNPKPENWLVAEASLPPGANLLLYYENNTTEVLRRGLTGLAISLLTALVIVWVLLYLYRTIRQQKELAEIKNDLISNLTHEFKTPIATVATALEGIEKFNDQNDPAKTKKYLDISTQQLNRLNHMVEKLLETATLEQDQLSLKLEQTDISALLVALCTKYSVLEDRNIKQDIQPAVLAQVDVFHFENAVSNLLDNAIKYGGENIRVQLYKNEGQCVITVQDDGDGIKLGQQEKVFDKFYRIPTGNQHDVKGYGIGLYYSRKIIEKHGGQLRLKSKPHFTEFTMIL